jgi:hypothetical protein
MKRQIISVFFALGGLVMGEACEQQYSYTLQQPGAGTNSPAAGTTSSSSPITSAPSSGPQGVAPSGSGGITTGNPVVDGPTMPITSTIGSVDPDFNASNVYYASIDVAADLISLLTEIEYTASPQSCVLDFSGSVAMLSNSGSRNLNLNQCAGFEAAAVVASKNSGECTPQVVGTTDFNLPTISFVRTTELSSTCLCFRRYKLTVLNSGTISDEVRVFLDNATCSAAFSVYQ